MAENIVDVNKFDPVPLIEKDEPVLGGLDGPSNKQAIVLANRTLFLKEEKERVEKKVDELTPEDIGAEVAGTADSLMTQHVENEDPHPGYMNSERGDERYLQKSGSNLPNGPLVLDKNGKIPEGFLEIFKSDYIIVADDAERLSVKPNTDLIIVSQVSDSTLYYLNGGLDPSKPENWIKGQSATTVGVAKVFGRTGNVEPQTGDYNADQITETPQRVFLTPDQKASLLFKQDRLISGTNIKTILGKTILGSGDLKLTPSDIGADPEGTAKSILDTHVAEDDPHTQYLKKDAGNQPLGYLQLDDKGKIPAGTVDILKARYVIVADDAARLALDKYDNLTIAAQLNGPNDDDDRMYYLNGGLDPANPDNWFVGQSAVLQGVPSIFGRTGQIVAEQGDYTSEQITETGEKLFVSPAEKSAWNGKQDKLESGKSIKTILGKAVLGSGNITFSPSDIGAAKEVHKHTVSEITDWKKETQNLITGSLEAGDGIAFGQNTVTGKTIITATGGGSGSGKEAVSIERLNSKAAQIHTFNIKRQDKFNLSAHALREYPGSSNVTSIVDDFTSEEDSPYLMTPSLQMDGSLRLKPNYQGVLTKGGDLYSSLLDMSSELISVIPDIFQATPVMTSNTAPAGNTVSASSTYTTYTAYRAFDASPTVGNKYANSWVSAAAPTEAAPQWIAIALSAATPINSYRLINRLHSSDANNDVTPAVSWKLQGSNDGSTWTDIHEVKDSVNDFKAGASRSYDLGKTVSFKNYRIYITKSLGNRVSFNKVILGNKANFVVSHGGKYYKAEGNALTEIKETVDSDYINSLTSSSITDLETVNYKEGFKIVSNTATGINVIRQSGIQIAIAENLTPSAWLAINSSKVDYTKSGNGAGFIAVTRDFTTWSVYKDGKWSSIGVLTPDEEGVTNISANGMSFDDFGKIPAAAWAEFYADVDGVPDTIAFAIGLSVPNSTVDSIAVNAISLIISEESSWKLQTATEVEIRWRRSSISFKTVAAGNYKFVYDLP